MKCYKKILKSSKVMYFLEYSIGTGLQASFLHLLFVRLRPDLLRSLNFMAGVNNEHFGVKRRRLFFTPNTSFFLG